MGVGGSQEVGREVGEGQWVGMMEMGGERGNSRETGDGGWGWGGVRRWVGRGGRGGRGTVGRNDGDGWREGKW